MKLRHVVLSVALAVCAATASVASATVLSVSGLAGPWDPSISGNPAYGVGDNTAPTSLAVNAGDNIVITYLSGLTTAFGGLPTVDALGYVGNIFGSGLCCSGIGSSGQPFPSFYLDPLNTGPQIALNALIGDFVDSSGKILDEFAPGNGPFSIVAPTGAIALQLGINDDIFADNAGALNIEVTGSTATASVPEPATWAMLLLGFGSLGAARRRHPLARAA